MRLADVLAAAGEPGIVAQPRERARAYVRVSHERSAEKAISPETQRRRIEAYARDRGYDITAWYTELAKSAFRDDDLRTEFRRMIADAKADPETSVILVYRYDRFSRGSDAFALQSELLRTGIRIESAEEGYYDPESEAGAIMMPLTWSLNRLFSIKLRNVVIPNMKTNFEQRDPETGWAYKNGGWAQFGYRTERVKLGKGRKGQDIHKQIWVLDEIEVAGKPVHEWARTVLLDWRLKQRLGYDSIAARLTAAGVPTASGRGAWSPSSVQALLGAWDRLFQYAGYAFWNREDCTDRNNRRRRDPSEWVVVENAHPAIITEDEAGEIYAMVQDRKRTQSHQKDRASRWVLTGGLLKCAHCGANYAGTTKKGHDYYVCGSYLYRRGADCPGPSWYIPREEIENLVFGKILKMLARDEQSLREWVDEVNEATEREWQAYQQTAADRKKRIRQWEKKLGNLLDAVANTGPTEDLNSRIRELNADLARLRRLDSVERPPVVDFTRILALQKQVQTAAASTDATLRQEIIRAFVMEITADAESKTLDGLLSDPRSVLPVGESGGGAKGS